MIKCRLTIIISLTAVTMAATPLDAATGDILFQCNFDGPGSTAGEVWKNCGGDPTTAPDSMIVAGGVSGKAVKTTLSTTTGVYKETWGPFKRIMNFGQEITATWYEKFDHPAIPGGNIKGIRVLQGQGYIGGVSCIANKTTADTGNMWYQAVWGPPNSSGVWGDGYDAILTPNLNKISLSGIDYCKKIGPLGYPTNTTTNIWDGRYWCEDHLGFKWRNSTGSYQGYGDLQWHKFRFHIKVPSSTTATDGMITLWIDEELAYRLTGIGKSTLTHTYTTEIVWEPSLGGEESFSHFYDEIKVYKGYVPPSLVPADSNLILPVPPTGLKVTRLEFPLV